MTVSHLNSFLGRLPYDVRLELYSYITLPPFEGWSDYSGLWLSCRQLYEEVDREGTRQLRIYLQSISGYDSIKSDHDGTPEGCSDGAEQHLSLEFEAPSSIFGFPPIGVKIPFLLPPVEHDWQLQGPPPRICGNGVRAIMRLGPQNPKYHKMMTRWEQGRQEALYKRRVSKLLEPIGWLHRLHVNIKVCLLADESTATRITKEATFDKQLVFRPELASTALGQMLDIYVHQLSDQSSERMRCWSEDWAFYTHTIDMAWDFTSHDPEVREQHQWRPHYGGDECRENKLSYTGDRREGTVHMTFDVGTYVQMRVSEVQGQIEAMIAEGRAERDKAMLDRFKETLAQNKKKLRKLGISGREPESGDSRSGSTRV
ncbi:uncharacterized protein EKO05_0002057 [Ascochyta rabiei]|uniref:Uncharacterized protein n=1 Tax=Didymella rabiei TaxID=5454 RepID=A0A163LQZ5_DIDRA|nr:uncharacterized protein EKO05_0002057 [Ascochyta rabiei]KZM28028.1 hypothetical protein ST47_g851 [Ascochyta rabiei]UPX11451.1 hypothetical protein EKO05_0002057 [Ascochyta rabiei]